MPTQISEPCTMLGTAEPTGIRVAPRERWSPTNTWGQAQRRPDGFDAHPNPPAGFEDGRRETGWSSTPRRLCQDLGVRGTLPHTPNGGRQVKVLISIPTRGLLCRPTARWYVELPNTFTVPVGFLNNYFCILCNTPRRGGPARGAAASPFFGLCCRDPKVPSFQIPFAVLGAPTP